MEDGGVLKFLPGHFSGAFEVHLVDDNLFEERTEDFTVSLVDRGAEDSKTKRVDVHADEKSAQMRIRDNDRLSAAIYADAESVAEGQDASFTVALSGAVSTAPVSVLYNTGGSATSGVDYTAPSGTLTIPAGKHSGVIDIATLTDNLLDPDETLKVSMAEATSLSRSLQMETDRHSDTLTILEEGTLLASVAAAEGTEGGQVQFTITLL